MEVNVIKGELKMKKKFDTVTMEKALDIYELLSKAMSLLAEMASLCFDRIKEERDES